MYPNRVISKRIRLEAFPGVLFVDGNVYAAVTPSKTKHRDKIFVLALASCVLATVLICVVSYVFYLKPYGDIVHQEKMAEEELVAADSMFSGVKLSDIMSDLELTDHYVTYFAEDLVVVTIRSGYNLNEVLERLVSVKGVLGFQHSLDGFQVMLLRGAL